MSQPELLPCPFCGEPGRRDAANEDYVMCASGKHNMIYLRDVSWNRRAARPGYVAVPSEFRDLAKQAADALKIWTGHDSNFNARHHYGEKWWEPIEALEKKLRAAAEGKK